MGLHLGDLRFQIGYLQLLLKGVSEKKQQKQTFLCVGGFGSSEVSENQYRDLQEKLKRGFGIELRKKSHSGCCNICNMLLNISSQAVYSYVCRLHYTVGITSCPIWEFTH